MKVETKTIKETQRSHVQKIYGQIKRCILSKIFLETLVNIMMLSLTPKKKIKKMALEGLPYPYGCKRLKQQQNYFFKIILIWAQFSFIIILHWGFYL